MPRAATTTDVFNAIAEPRRREILSILDDGQNHPVGDVVRALGMPQPGVSKHLRVLLKVGVVSVTKQGQLRLYRLNAKELKPVHDWVKTYERYWTHQIDQIKERAERKNDGPNRSREPNKYQGEMSMLSKPEEETIQTFEIIKDEQIAAPIDVVFETILEQMGPLNTTPDGASMSLKLEAWPGGRWSRDLGNNMGHFWGHVQAIKPPTLLEICGPLMMSFPVVSNVQYPIDGGKRNNPAEVCPSCNGIDSSRDNQRGKKCKSGLDTYFDRGFVKTRSAEPRWHTKAVRHPNINRKEEFPCRSQNRYSQNLKPRFPSHASFWNACRKTS